MPLAATSSGGRGAAGLVQMQLHEILHHRHVGEQISLQAPHELVGSRRGRARDGEEGDVATARTAKEGNAMKIEQGWGSRRTSEQRRRRESEATPRGLSATHHRDVVSRRHPDQTVCLSVWPLRSNALAPHATEWKGIFTSPEDIGERIVLPARAIERERRLRHK